MTNLKKFILIIAALPFITSCAAVNPEEPYTPTAVMVETLPQIQEETLTPQPPATRTPIPTYYFAKVTEVGNFLTISQIFEQYGKPEGIWFSSTGEVPENWPTYIRIVVFYPLDNRLFVFWGKADQLFEDEKPIVSICAAKYDDITVEGFVTTAFTWQPSPVIKFEDLLPLPGIPDIYWKPLEEVTDINVDDFYSGTLADPETTCIKSPAGIWPNPDN